MTKMDLSDPGQSRIEQLSFAIAGVLCLVLGLVFAESTRHGPAKEQIQLKSRINPNTAPVCSLVRLPQIGMVRAAVIIEYRDIAMKETERSRVFASAKDLEKVKGIGPKTSSRISRWLEFE
jgi:DNA uptake protein ComE-like DNA-binding protein